MMKSGFACLNLFVKLKPFDVSRFILRMLGNLLEISQLSQII